MNNIEFDIVKVQSDELIKDETLGTKSKFWLRRDNKWMLFKEARLNTGEDWSEKLAAEIARLIDINSAKVELAECNGRRGIISVSFINRYSNEYLIHGNEILAGQVLGYNSDKRFGQCAHTIENIISAINKLFSSRNIIDQNLKQLASYMLLDGLIGNVDRHHENWGIVVKLISEDVKPKVSAYVAPSYDHASCLGRELLDGRITRLLADSHGVVNYILKGKGAIYIKPNTKHGVNPLKLLEFGNRNFPEYFEPSILNLKKVKKNDILALTDRVPESIMSQNAKEFVKRFLNYTYDRICKLIP